MAESPLRLTAVVTKEDDWYVARCLESVGMTAEEFVALLR